MKHCFRSWVRPFKYVNFNKINISQSGYHTHKRLRANMPVFIN